MFSRCHMARQQVTLTCPKYIQIRQMALLSLFYLVGTSGTHATFNSNASAVGETKISPSTRSVSSGGVTGSSFLHCHHSKRHHCGFRVQQKVWLPATSHKTSQNIKKPNPYSKIIQNRSQGSSDLSGMCHMPYPPVSGAPNLPWRHPASKMCQPPLGWFLSPQRLPQPCNNNKRRQNQNKDPWTIHETKLQTLNCSKCRVQTSHADFGVDPDSGTFKQNCHGPFEDFLRSIFQSGARPNLMLKDLICWISNLPLLWVILSYIRQKCGFSNAWFEDDSLMIAFGAGVYSESISEPKTPPHPQHLVYDLQRTGQNQTKTKLDYICFLSQWMKIQCLVSSAAEQSR